MALFDEALSVVPLDSIDQTSGSYEFIIPALISAGRLEEARSRKAAFDSGYVRGDWYEELLYQRLEFLLNGWLALGEGRIDESISHFESFRRQFERCNGCSAYILGELYEQLGDESSAEASYLGVAETPVYWSYQYWDDILGLAQSYERLGYIYDHRGEWENAAEYYTKFIELWENADEFLQPRVNAARERLDAVLVEAAREPSS